MTFNNQTIVITWEPKKYMLYGSFAALDAQRKMPIRIKGAGFNARERVIITACEKNIKVGAAIANVCGAFEMHVDLPEDLPLGVISVKAWVKEELKAVWPLDIVEELPPILKV